MNIEDLKNVVIHCPTKKDAIKCCEFANKLHFHWNGGESFIDNNNWDYFEKDTCDGDINELIRQLKDLNPLLTETEIDELAKLKTTELEKKTPKLITWQDWSWPCAEGDYCKFIGYVF
jgi:uncharacterized protein CbrC (UPF0167 family)